ncbi:MAG: ABC transporter ATP-binding protein [Acidobacteria bacterium]|nr:ABC transporter ATP-binding protein [Acidobacteriota bacterium]MXZ72713.1 ABC transporter ATP-binding protein [Acidobacteriota bacterium]MYD69826.1 ABC transporter ATP-binding protein [Acidobacteriota bacterium]MYJ03702.1 ABC transporter ATP-binding protein [Acidobacteriota bacterium]
MPDLTVSGLSVALGGRTIVDDASLQVGEGELVALLGANGAGKTTLLRGLLGLAPRTGGTVAIGGDDPARLGAAERARRVAYLPQLRPLAWPIRVRDLVALGRFAHGVALGRLGPSDAAAVERALTVCDLTAFAGRAATTLSGGELARVHVARAIAAEAPLLITDEPTAALDPLHQHQVMRLLRTSADAGCGVLVVTHDIGLAAQFADRLAWMAAGRVVADGLPEATLTADRIAQVYGVSATVRRLDGDWLVSVAGAA